MSKNQNIPILRSEAFGKVYLDEAPGKKAARLKHSHKSISEIACGV